MSAAKLLFDEPQITSEHFEIFANYIYKCSGIYLNEEQKNFSLMAHRLKKVLRMHSLVDYDDLSERIKAHQISDTLKTDFVNALTTNKTEFYREEIHFEIIPVLIKELANKDSIYIWCAACSTGQEPLTLMMTLDEKLPPNLVNKIKILATDIDTAVLKTATEAVYTEDQISGLSEAKKDKYFDTIHTIYSLKDEYRNRIHYSQLNLFDFPYPTQKRFDIILCRNVMIYFKQDDRVKVCEQLVQYLSPTGSIIFGISEAASLQIPSLQYSGNSVYRKKS